MKVRDRIRERKGLYLASVEESREVDVRAGLWKTTRESDLKRASGL